MVWFRLYFLKSDRIVSFNAFEAADDAEALALAAELADGVDAELWCGKRKVCRLEQSAPLPAAPIAS